MLITIIYMLIKPNYLLITVIYSSIMLIYMLITPNYMLIRRNLFVKNAVIYMLIMAVYMLIIVIYTIIATVMIEVLKFFRSCIQINSRVHFQTRLFQTDFRVQVESNQTLTMNCFRVESKLGIEYWIDYLIERKRGTNQNCYFKSNQGSGMENFLLFPFLFWSWLWILCHSWLSFRS